MSSPETRAPLLFALRRALRPLTQLLIRAGISFEEFADLSCGVYVESAIRDVDHATRPSRERIAVMTGLTRKQVDYFVENEGMLPEANPTLRAVLTEVLHKWHTTPEYVGPYGIPLELEFAKPAGRCFRSLVALVHPTTNPVSALDELLRIGAVAPTGGRHYRVITRSLMVPEALSLEVIEHFGERLSRLGATLEYNMDPKYADRRLERRVSADRGLPPELVQEFEKYARGRVMHFLSDLDNWLASQASEEADSGKRVDAGVNVFFYIEPSNKEDGLASLVSGPEIKARLNR